MRSRILAVVLLAAISVPGALAGERGLDFEARVDAQRAIERVYYSHQIGASLPFEQAVPEQVIREKVRKSLQESVALEQYWKQELTEPELQRELERIAAHTRFQTS